MRRSFFFLFLVACRSPEKQEAAPTPPPIVEPIVSAAPAVSVAPIASAVIDGSGPLTLADAGKNERELRAQEQRERLSRAVQIQAEEMAKLLTSTPTAEGALEKRPSYDLANALESLDAGRVSGGGSLRAGGGSASLRGLGDLERDH